MQQYLDLLNHVMTTGIDSGNRTGIYARKVFGYQMRFDLRDGFPLVTTKKIFTRGLVEELLWIMRGETNIKSLLDKNVHIWDEWANEDGDLGPVYGAQWRLWPTEMGYIDQLKDTTIDLINNYPMSRRIIINAWNPEYIPSDIISPQENVNQGKMALAPCHCLVQFDCEPMTVFDRISYATQNNIPWRTKEITEIYDNAINGYVDWHTLQLPVLDKLLDDIGIPKYYLSCQLFQRSVDSFLGLPFNIASYALLTHIIGQLTNTVPKEFIHTSGNLHIYSNHFDQITEQLRRDPKPLPKLVITEKLNFSDLNNWKADWFKFENYQHHPAIKGNVAV